MNSNQSPHFCPIARLRSFRYAFNGLRHLFLTQHNIWLHVIAAVLVISISFYFGIPRQDWFWIILCIALVLITEAVNTAIEVLADCVSKEPHPGVGLAKDLAAGAVLLAALFAAIIGVLIFGPYFLNL